MRCAPFEVHIALCTSFALTWSGFGGLGLLEKATIGFSASIKCPFNSFLTSIGLQRDVQYLVGNCINHPGQLKFKLEHCHHR